ncbi:hypothetical protein LCGC14_1476210 [marine sediment metagenome]|uniref:Sialidase domain-containing protein n=1 Tax=marine sediment metagenome TaxID=412755 RepID=A0A0F9JWV4_9ZZZZ
MVDTLVENTVTADLDERNGAFGPYWSDVSTGEQIHQDDVGNLMHARTTDKGASWTTTQIAVASALQVACWYDRETPGDTGTLVHIAFFDLIGDDFVFYITLDVSDGTIGTKRTVDSTITGGFFPADHRIAITKTVSGNLIVAFSTLTEVECYRSDDAGVTWTDRADVFETATEKDWCLLFPAAMADDDDACAMFWDRSANAITLKMYDESANTWTEFATAIAATAVDDAIHMNMDGAVRHSDSHILVAWHSDDDTTGDDLQTADLTVDSIASPTVTAKTNVVTNQAESAQVAVFINQQNDDVYVAYLKGGTWTSTVDVVYHLSDDGMATWGTEQAYSESVADDFRLVHAGRTVGNAGGRYQPSFYDDDQTDIYVNETNDIEIAAAGAPAGQPTQHRTQGIPTGSGYRDRPIRWN